MSSSRRATLLSLVAASLRLPAQDPQHPDHTFPSDHTPPSALDPDEDRKLPNGKSQKDAMAKQSHQDALKDIDALIALAEELRDQIKSKGDYVVDVSSLKKTEEIEKLAKRIRGKLKM